MSGLIDLQIKVLSRVLKGVQENSTLFVVNRTPNKLPDINVVAHTVVFILPHVQGFHEKFQLCVCGGGGGGGAEFIITAKKSKFSMERFKILCGFQIPIKKAKVLFEKF